MPDTETGAGDEIPADWPVTQQTIFGFATLVRDDLIEHSIGDGEVIATYAPATQPPPGCDRTRSQARKEALGAVDKRSTVQSAADDSP